MCYNKSMFLVGIFQWWYGDGLIAQIRRVVFGVLKTADYFSVGLLLRTLFNPFRQISAGYVDGPLPVKLQAFFDRSFSRMVGAVVRTIVLLFGLVVIFVRIVWALLNVLAWLIIPAMPLIGIILWQMGVAL